MKTDWLRQYGQYESIVSLFFGYFIVNRKVYALSPFKVTLSYKGDSRKNSSGVISLTGVFSSAIIKIKMGFLHLREANLDLLRKAEKFLKAYQMVG